MIVIPDRQTKFYREFLMAREKVNPHDYGVDMERPAFDDLLVERFNEFSSGLSFDEMLLRPRVAMQFCDQVRQRQGWFDLPDDIILRVVMIRRKNP